jgi:hypothetical protein
MVGFKIAVLMTVPDDEVVVDMVVLTTNPTNQRVIPVISYLAHIRFSAVPFLNDGARAYTLLNPILGLSIFS